MNHVFSDYHPIVNFIYFIVVLTFCMLLNHPVSQGISLLCALAYAWQLLGKKAIRFTLSVSLPMILLATIVNPLFNHNGNTVIGHFPTGSALTLESVLYGLSAGCMLACVLLWFMCFHQIITPHKLQYLLGRAIPSLSLVLGMTLRLVPRFKKQLTAITESQQCLGRSITKGNLRQRIQTAATILSILITWSLEGSLQTADSMKSRGYGLKGRTTFSLYRFNSRDTVTLIWILSCGLICSYGLLTGRLTFEYFPGIQTTPVTITAALLQGLYFALCITPVVLEGKAVVSWKASH